jgi:hypothetical protein
MADPGAEPAVSRGDAPVRGVTVHGDVPFPALWLGVGCLGLGIFLANGYRAGLFEPAAGSPLRPWMFAAFAAMALVVGAAFAVFGVRDVRRALARRRGLAAGHAAEAWKWDHPWNRRGIADGSASELVTLWIMAPVWCLLLSPFVAIIFFPDGDFNWRGGGGDEPVWVTIMVAAFALAGFGLAFQALRGLLVHLVRGPTFLRFHHFPYVLGGRLEATLETPARISADRVTATLRCLREHVVREVDRRSARTTSLRTEHENLHEATIAIELGGGATRRVPIAFELPADAPATRLSDTPPVYWKLVVELPGRTTTFVVPVYQRP